MLGFYGGGFSNFPAENHSCEAPSLAMATSPWHAFTRHPNHHMIQTPKTKIFRPGDPINYTLKPDEVKPGVYCINDDLDLNKELYLCVVVVSFSSRSWARFCSFLSTIVLVYWNWPCLMM